MNKQNVVYVYSRILLSLQNEGTSDICYKKANSGSGQSPWEERMRSYWVGRVVLQFGSTINVLELKDGYCDLIM